MKLRQLKNWGARLEQLKLNQQQQLEVETLQKRGARLEQLKLNQLQERGARLEQLKLNQQQRLEAETLEQKVTRLDRMSTLQQERLENETPEQRSVRLDQVKLNRASCFHKPNGRPIPSLNDKCVKEKVNVLHKEMVSTESPMCSTCLEKFPGTKMASKSSECQRCYRDKKVPKLFSADNNMSPESVQDELQVSF